MSERAQEKESERMYLQSCSDHTHLTEEEFSSSFLSVVLLRYQTSRAQKKNLFHSDPNRPYMLCIFLNFFSEYSLISRAKQDQTSNNGQQVPYLQPLLLIQVISFSNGQVCHPSHKLHYQTSSSCSD